VWRGGVQVAHVSYETRILVEEVTRQALILVACARSAAENLLPSCCQSSNDCGTTDTMHQLADISCARACKIEDPHSIYEWDTAVSQCLAKANQASRAHLPVTH
jgi:hypothetical protein